MLSRCHGEHTGEMGWERGEAGGPSPRPIKHECVRPEWPSRQDQTALDGI